MSKSHRYDKDSETRPNNYSNVNVVQSFMTERPMFDFKNEDRMRYERRKGGCKGKRPAVRW